MKKLTELWLLMIMACFATSCSQEDIDDPEPSPTPVPDSLWYEVTSMSTFTAKEFADSLCTIQPEAAKYMPMITMLLPKELELTVVDFLYDSKNGYGMAVKMSGQLIVPVNNGKEIQNLVIDNHATQTADADVPTNRLNIGSVLALKGDAVVTSDLLGYGATVNLPISYNCRHTAAINTVDAALVAQEILHSEWMNLPVGEEPLAVYNEGYSQGGYDALAVHRYLEVEASDKVREQLPLVKSRCGAGAYDQKVFLETVLSWDSYDYSPYIVAGFLSFMNYHPEVLPKDFDVNSILTPQMQGIGIVDMLKSKQYNDSQTTSYVRMSLGGDVSISNLFEEDFINPNGYLHKVCTAAAEHENLLRGWKPTKPIHFFNAKNDDCVPVECMYAAKEAFGDCSNVTFEELNTPSKSGLHSLSYVDFIIGVLIKGEF